MRRLSIGASLLFLSLPLCAQQTKPVQVCVVSADLRGPGLQQSASLKPERERLLYKINSSSKEIQLKARDADSGEGLSCSVPRAADACGYIVAVSPITVGSYQYHPPTPLPSSADANRIEPPPWSSIYQTQESQSQPVDQASVRVQVFQNGNCRLVAFKSFFKLQTIDGPPTGDSIEWLTSKIAEQVSKAIVKDSKLRHP